MQPNKITMYGTTWCQDCKRAKKFFGEHRIPYDFIDVDQDLDGLRLVEQTNAGKRIIPTIFFQDGTVVNAGIKVGQQPGWCRVKSGTHRPASGAVSGWLS